MLARTRLMVATVLVSLGGWTDLHGGEVVEHSFLGITHITRTETSPRNLRMHVVLIDLTVPGVAFRLTPPGIDLPPMF